MSDSHTSPDYFPPTAWTQLFAEIQKADTDRAWPALVAFCELYRPAILRFFARHTVSPQQAEDYTQAFFQTKILERWDGRATFLHSLERKEGHRFRSFLCYVLWNFLKDQWRTETTKRAGGGAVHVALEELLAGPDAPEESFRKLGSEFDRVFALEILRRAAERSRHSKHLIAHLRGEISQKQAADEMGLSENAFKAAYHRFRERLARDLWDEVSQIAGPDEAEVKAEISYLMGLFAEAAA